MNVLGEVDGAAFQTHQGGSGGNTAAQAVPSSTSPASSAAAFAFAQSPEHRAGAAEQQPFVDGGVPEMADLTSSSPPEWADSASSMLLSEDSNGADSAWDIPGLDPCFEPNPSGPAMPPRRSSSAPNLLPGRKFHPALHGAP